MNNRPEIPVLMTRQEFAAHKGVGKSAVSNWSKRKLLVFAEDPAGGKPKIHVERTEQRLAAHIDPGRGRPSTAQAAAEPMQPGLPHDPPRVSAAPAAGGVGEVRTDLIKAQTVQLNLKNAKAAGELVEAAEFETRASEYGRLTRERTYAVIRANAERLAAETDPRAIVAILTGEMDAAFTDLAGSINTAPSESEDAEIDAEIEASVLEEESA